MTIKNYRILYHKYYKTRNKQWSYYLIINVLVSLILVFFITKDSVHLVFEVFSLIYLMMNITSVFTSVDSKYRSYSNLISFFKTTPVPSYELVINNFILRAFAFDTNMFYLMVAMISLLWHVSLIELLLLYARMLESIVIAQLIETVLFVTGKRLFYRTLIQSIAIFILFLVAQLHQKQTYYMFTAIFTKTYNYDIFVGGVFLLSLVFLVPMTRSVLFDKTTNHSKKTELISSHLSKISKLVFFNPVLKTTVHVQLLRYIRDTEIQNKYTKLFIMAMAYSIFHIMLSNQFSLWTESWILAVMFFSEFDITGVFESKLSLSFFPISKNIQKITQDSISFIFYLFFCESILFVMMIITRKPWSEFLSITIAIFVFGFIRNLIAIPLKISRISMFKYTGIYGVISLLFLLIMQLSQLLLVNIVCACIFIFIYYLNLRRVDSIV